VRGFTRDGIKELIEVGGVFKLVKLYGGNFYPFSRRFATVLAKLFPTLAVSIFFDFQKVENKEYLDLFENNFFETNFKGQKGFKKY